jgi:hypothetical protein
MDFEQERVERVTRVRSTGVVLLSVKTSGERRVGLLHVQGYWTPDAVGTCFAVTNTILTV